MKTSPKRRIKVGELLVGTPLPFDVFDSENRLLLRRGNRISSESQLDRLIRQGIFYGDSKGQVEDPPAPIPAETTPLAPPAPEVSAFRMLDDCAHSLDQLLRSPSPQSDAGFANEVRFLAARIRRLCLSDSDAALAYVLLGQAPNHAVRQQINVSILTALMASRLAPGSVRAETAVCAALTMNFGMMELADQLYWIDQPLDATQRAALELHPIVSAQMLGELGVEDCSWLEIVRQHHEALDASGYPCGLREEQICQEARIIGIADRYNGMVANRAYRRGMAPDFALKELARRDARKTDPSLLGLLIRVIGVYPPATVVALVNKEVGIVTKRLLDLKHPIVHTFYLDPYWPYDKPVKRFTGRMPQFQIARVLPRDELNFTIDPEQLWPPACLVEAMGT